MKFLITTTAGDCCLPGFPTFDNVQTLSSTCSSCTRDTGDSQGSTYIIPGMNFTCSGTISKWRAAGEIIYRESNGKSSNRLPMIQIWQSNNNRFSRISEIPLLDCNGAAPMEVDIDTNVYECQLDVRVEVQQGSILGVYLARNHRSRDQFAVYFSTNPHVPLLNYYSYSGDASEQTLSSSAGIALPLIALELIPDNGMSFPIYISLPSYC